MICNSPAVTDDWQSEENNGNTIKCPAGYECFADPDAEVGPLEPTPCPVGTFYNYQDETCTACPSSSECQDYAEYFNINDTEAFCGSFTGSFSNQLGSFECTPCGEQAEQSLSGQETCVCLSKHRNFRATDQKCECQSGYEAAETEDGDCTRIIYELCKKEGYFRSVDGTCVTEEEMTDYCRTTGCPAGAFDSFDKTLGICKCVGDPLDENCNFDCRQRNEKLVEFVCPDPLLANAEPFLSVGGVRVNVTNGLNSQDVLSSKSCGANSIETSSPVYILGADQSPAFKGIYNPDPSLVESILSVSTRRKRQANPLLVDLGSEFEVTQPATCLELDTIVMFMVSAAAYPKYDRESLFNVNDFDSAAFEDMEENVPEEPIPFFYRFYQPGVFAFSLVAKNNGEVESLNRDLYVQVVSSEGKLCFVNFRFVFSE